VQAFVTCFFSASFVATAELPSGTSGLMCLSRAGARLRLNIDLNMMRFQKEGFPSYPIVAASADQLVLTRLGNADIRVMASIDRHTLIYTALTRQAASGTISETKYQCTAGVPFDLAAGRQGGK
jgi:hypothetical protein